MIINVKSMGMAGVNVDKDPLELDDNELTRARNVITDVQAGRSAIRKRPGYVAFNTAAAAGEVLGGIGVPLQDKSASGTHFFYIGRGPLS